MLRALSALLWGVQGRLLFSEANPKGPKLEKTTQRRALYGPMPVKTETFRELRAPFNLVHTNFEGNSYGPIIGPYLFLGEIRMDQWS